MSDWYTKIEESNLKRIFSNILDNSYEACMQRDDSSRLININLNLSFNRKSLEITFDDNGIGIKDDLIPKIGKKGY